MSTRNATTGLAVLALCMSLAAAAEDTMNAGGMPIDLQRPTLEARLGAQQLSDGYGDWREATLIGTYFLGRHTFRAEVSALRRFDESGAYLGVMDTVTLDPDWYASLALGAGDGAFYLPRYRADAFLNRKLLAARNLVASVGAGYYRAPDGHIDRSVTVGGAYYFDAPWIVQAAVRFGESDPGNVRARQQIVALTYGREPGDVVVGRYSWGREAYLAIGPSTSLVGFESREASLMWRHRLDRDRGVALVVEHYRNPSYRRTGLALQFFIQLP